MVQNGGTMITVIELVSGYCNSKCAWCFSQYQTGKQIEYGFMDFHKFRNLVFRDGNFLSGGVIPFSHGEALLYPDFVRAINTLISMAIPLHGISTNLSMEIDDQEIFQALGLFQTVVVNLGGTTKETHEANMQTPFDRLLGNIKSLRDAGGKIQLKMVINRVNAKDPLFCCGLPVKPYPVYFSTSDSTDAEKLEFYKRNLGEGVDCRDFYEFDGSTVKVKPKINHCSDNTLTVRYNGMVQVCCRTRKQEGIVGNAFNTPLPEIVASRTYADALARARERKYVSYCQYCS
jgi:sulfatase maturation enzyme AslB (radical SAM superfamily)